MVKHEFYDSILDLMNKVAYKYLEETYIKPIKNKRGSMKNIFKIARTITIFFVVFMGVGCTSATYFHTSTPVSKILEDPLFTASVEPVKKDSNFFSLFRLYNNRVDIDFFDIRICQGHIRQSLENRFYNLFIYCFFTPEII